MKRKETTTEFLRRWKIPENRVRAGKNWLRYKNPLEKGVYWYWFSLFIRERDVSRWGTCISCDRPITVETSDCGHFIPASQCGIGLLFDLRNNNAECPHCNAWDELHLIGYAKGLDKRYGPGTADLLLTRHKDARVRTVRDFKKEEYEHMILTLPNFPK